MGIAFSSALDALVDEFNANKPIRVWSLIVTLFGDAIVPRGGELWAGNVNEVLASFGIGDAPVRAALSRLAKDGWLERSRDGRLSFYRLTGIGSREFLTATQRIYFGAAEDWSGGWRLALLPTDLGPRADLRRYLRAEGFGTLAPDIMIAPVHASTQTSALGDVERDIADGIVWLQAGGEAGDAREIAQRAWQLDDIAAAYRSFMTAFEPLHHALIQEPSCDPLAALAARLLLIHRFRRIVLRDPQLPQALLPDDWPGGPARELCAETYKALVPSSERWLEQHAQSRSGALALPDASFHQRFGQV